MRIDQYLKIARIVKKRPASKALALQQRILINGKAAKPSSEVKVDDVVECYFGNRHIKIQVLALADSIKKAQSMTLYTVLHEERIQSPSHTQKNEEEMV